MEALFTFESWNVSVATVGTVLLIVSSTVWAGASAYSRVMGVLATLTKDIEEMKQKNAFDIERMNHHNAAADLASDSLKQEQSSLKTTIAVTSEKMANVEKTSERIEATLNNLLHEIRIGKV